MIDNKKLRRRTIFVHRDAKQFKDFKWGIKAFISALKGRLKVEKDVLILISGATGCQPKGSKVLMSNGDWKNIEDIREGDIVLSPQKDGTNKFSKVINTNSWICPETYDVYQTNKTNKLLYSCSNNHIIPYFNRKIIRKTEDGKRKQTGYEWNLNEKSAEEFSKISDNTLSHNIIGFSSFEVKKFQNRKDCEIDPYTLGFYLGDGSFSKSLNITSSQTKIMEEISKTYSPMSVWEKKGTSAKSYCYSLNSVFAKQLIKYKLKGKLSKSKFIPKEALLSSSDYRKNLLAGLIDSDGYFSGAGYSYSSKSKKLIEDLRDLVYSLGGRTGEIRKIVKKIKSINFKGTYYEISFYVGNLKLPIKKERNIKKNNCIYLSPNRISIKCTKNKQKKVYGFEIDSPSNLYVTDNWMVTHNSGKSMLAGNFCLKYFSKEPNFITNEGMMFERENFIIDPEELAVKMITKSGSVLWADEGRRAANRRDWFSKINKTIIARKNQNRKLFNIYFILMPYEKEFDPALANHLTLWLWVRRGVAEVYCANNERKGGSGLDITKILEREEKWLKENSKSTFVIPTIHPEFIGRIFFSDLTPGYKKEYMELVEEKKAVGDLSEEEKLKFGIIEQLTPERMINNAIDDIKDGKIASKRQLWNLLKEKTDLKDSVLLKQLNFYLKLEGYPTFNKLFENKKVDKIDDIF